MSKTVILRAIVLLLISFASLLSFAQRKISGTVIDEKGNPLGGTTVSVKGRHITTTTNSNGLFTINVPEDAKTILVTYVGMESQEIPVTSNGTINVTMKSSSSTLNDVVVVGYGWTRRANLTSAQTSVSAKEIEKTVNTTIEQYI